MPYQPNRLRELRKGRNLSIVRLSELSKVSERTIQRLENPKDRDTTPHPSTVERLAKALHVEPEALVGESPPEDSGREYAPVPDRVQIGALIAPKARLAYDLVKKRYGVSATEIINVAPLFFALLAEGSLVRRRERTREAQDSIVRLDQVMGLDADCDLLSVATMLAENAVSLENESIAQADIFGEHILSCDDHIRIPHEPFDPAIRNPFADYLRQLAGDLDNPGVVDTTTDLSYGSPYGKMPDYQLCSNKVDWLANGSTDAKRALETGHARLSEIPEPLMVEDAGEKRAAWLAERLPDAYRNLEENDPMAEMAQFESTQPPGEWKARVESAVADLDRLGFGSEEAGGPQR